MTTIGVRQHSKPDYAPVELHAPNWLVAFVLMTGLVAFVASSCCIVPLSLAAAGVSVAFIGVLEIAAEWRFPILGVSRFAILMGWIMWPPGGACPVTGRPLALQIRWGVTPGLLLCATVILVLAARIGPSSTRR